MRKRHRAIGMFVGLFLARIGFVIAGPAAFLTFAPGVARAAQGGADEGLLKGADEIARGDFYRALLTLKDVARRLEPEAAARPEARKNLAYTHAYLAWAYVGMNRPEEAEGAVRSALAVEPALIITAGVFPPQVTGLFERARRPQARDPEAAGRAALAAGKPQEALLEFLRALHSLGASPDATREDRLRREIIETVRGMDPPPSVPVEARKGLERAKALDEARAVLGAFNSAASSTAVVAELQAVLRLAPWWPEALFKLAEAQQGLGRLDDALATLSLYKLADPAGVVRDTVSPRAASSAPAASPAPVLQDTAGPGTIVVYWPRQFKGAGRPKIKCDGARVADLAKGRLIRISAEAGLHNVTFYNDTAGVRVSSGSLSYLRTAAVGFPARAEIREVSAQEAEAEIAKGPIEPNESKKTYSDTCGAGK